MLASNWDGLDSMNSKTTFKYGMSVYLLIQHIWFQMFWFCEVSVTTSDPKNLLVKSKLGDKKSFTFLFFRRGDY